MKRERIKKLNKRHKRFCDEYLKDFNATRAYKSIYPTAKDETASVNGAKLLRNAKVASYLSEHLKKAEIESVASLNDLLRTITAIALKKPRKTIFKRIDNTKEDKNGKPKVICDEITIAQPSDKAQLKALELLARYYNIFMNVEDPKLTKAKLRKLNADADYSEERVKAMKQLTNEDNRVLDDLLNKVHTGVIEDENEKSVD